MRTTRIGSILVIVLTALGVLVTATGAGAAPPPNNTNTAEQVKLSGSDTIYFLLNDLAVAYNESQGCDIQANYGAAPALEPSALTCKATQPASIVETENYDHDTVINYFPVGSSEGFRQLCRREAASSFNIQVARSSSSPTVQAGNCTTANGGDTGARFRWVNFAIDSLTWVYWGGGHSVSDLTVQNLKDIFVNCSMTHWSQATHPGPAPYPAPTGEAIRVFTAIPGSGSRPTWDSFLGGSTDNCIPAPFKDNVETNGERVMREHQAVDVEAVNAGQEAVGLGQAPCNGATPPAGCASAVDERWSIFGAFGCGLHQNSPSNRSNSLAGTVAGNACDAPAFAFRRGMWLALGQSCATGDGCTPGDYPVASAAARRFTDMRLTYTPGTSNPLNLGYICMPLNAHSKPATGGGTGTPNVAANKNYGVEKEQIMSSSGFSLLIDDPAFYPTTPRGDKPMCKVEEWKVNPSGNMTLVASGP